MQSPVSTTLNVMCTAAAANPDRVVYIGCPDCTKILTKSEGRYYCDDCRKHGQEQYKMGILIRDESHIDGEWTTAFGFAARRLLGVDIDGFVELKPKQQKQKIKGVKDINIECYLTKEAQGIKLVWLKKRM